MHLRLILTLALLSLFTGSLGRTQSAPDTAALKGLAPVSVLLNTDAGKAALAANYKVTGDLQSGALAQPTLLPFPQQREQALEDATITDANLAQLADGLGTTLGAAYLARFHYIDAKHTSAMPDSISTVIHYATRTAGAHSNQGKFFFANGTTNGTLPVPGDTLQILKQIGGTTDVFGKAYKRPAGTQGADSYGDSRPFQTETTYTRYWGTDYFSNRSDNSAYNYGPAMNLVNSPSYPSGHTTYGYTGSVLLAILVPQRYAEMIARGAEYGNDRILMGSHYAMDVLGGRTLALYDMAHLLANDPAYLNNADAKTPMPDFRAAIKKAQQELATVLQTGCGETVTACAREDTGRFSHPAADEAFYASTQTYDLGVVYTQTANGTEDVQKLAPEAGYLLTVAFPSLTLEQADRILTETEGPGGGFLDNGSSFGVYSRINLYAAGRRAAQMAAQMAAH